MSLKSERDLGCDGIGITTDIILVFVRLFKEVMEHLLALEVLVWDVGLGSIDVELDDGP